jgi:hypothetical protein
MFEYIEQLLLYYRISSFVIAMIPGLLAGLIGIGGVLLSDHLARKREEGRWQRQQAFEEERWRKEIEFEKKKWLVQLRNSHIAPIMALSTDYFGLSVILTERDRTGVAPNERGIKNTYLQYTNVIFELREKIRHLVLSGIFPLMMEGDTRLETEVFEFIRPLDQELQILNRDDFGYTNINSIHLVESAIHEDLLELPSVLARVAPVFHI